MYCTYLYTKDSLMLNPNDLFHPLVFFFLFFFCFFFCSRFVFPLTCSINEKYNSQNKVIDNTQNQCTKENLEPDGVSFSYTFSCPRTMVVIFFNTNLTFITMDGSGWSKRRTAFTITPHTFPFFFPHNTT